ncbi:MAG: NAD(P)-binding protein [Planctomycetes bacterium]|nr:NAD(P)-binding protein [Planctomycetota bacterium]
MPIRVTNLRLSIDEPEAELPLRLARTLRIQPTDLQGWRILRKSLDVRNKHDLRFVYSAEVTVPDEAGVAERAAKFANEQVELFREPPFELPAPGSASLSHRPVVIGSGPGGLVAAYFLALQGYQPLLLERGTPVNERIRDVKRFDAGGEFHPESNYLFGEGGAGTFSDGKLTCRGAGPDVHRVLELFAECKGKPEILYEHRPHLGSNRLPAVVKAIRRRIEEMGGEVRFHCKLEDLIIQNGRLTGLVTSSGTIPAEVALLATGHSARDVYQMLVDRGVQLERKPFQMGVRVEHSQETVNRIQFGREKHEATLGNADYTLVAKGAADVFTFCMCAGGHIIPSVSREGFFCTNGMSLSKRDSRYANSGLVVTIPVEHFAGTDILAGVRLQEIYERKAFEIGRGDYRCPVQSARDFLADRASKSIPDCSYPREKVAVHLAEVLPPYVVAALQHGLPKFDHIWRGRFLPEAVLVGPEARGSSPIRIVRDDATRESPGITGLYPVGEGAGYAGGIVSAGVDGLRTAKAVMQRYAPLGK